jgi:biotin operon repressor
VHCRLLRAREQVEKVKLDIRAFAAYYEALVLKLAAADDQPLCGEVLGQYAGSSRVLGGLRALLQKGAAFVAQQRQLGRQLLSTIEQLLLFVVGAEDQEWW